MIFLKCEVGFGPTKHLHGIGLIEAIAHLLIPGDQHVEFWPAVDDTAATLERSDRARAVG